MANTQRFALDDKVEALRKKVIALVAEQAELVFLAEARGDQAVRMANDTTKAIWEAEDAVSAPLNMASIATVEHASLAVKKAIRAQDQLRDLLERESPAGERPNASLAAEQGSFENLFTQWMTPDQVQKAPETTPPSTAQTFDETPIWVVGLAAFVVSLLALWVADWFITLAFWDAIIWSVGVAIVTMAVIALSEAIGGSGR